MKPDKIKSDQSDCEEHRIPAGSDEGRGTSRRRLLKAAAWAPPLAVAVGGTQLLQGFAKGARAQSVSDATELGVREAASRIQKGEMKAEDYVGQLFRHYNAHKDLNAFITINETRVLQDARAVDQARARGDRLGALAGVPIVVKDKIDVAGYPTTGGSLVLKGYVAKQTAPVIDAMLKAGAVMFGKTNCSDTITGAGGGGGAASGNRNYPFCRNPYDLSRVPGGSSTGTGAAIGARIVPGGIGEDTGGSVRLPSAFCGVAGLRPSGYAMENFLKGTNRKRYSGVGMIPPPTWLTMMGSMARTVSDVALLDTVITGEEVPTVSLRKTRLGIPRGDYWEKRPHDPGVRQVTEAVFAKLRDAGVQLIEIDLNGLLELSARDRLSPAVRKGNRPMADWLAENYPSVTVEETEAIREEWRADPEPRNHYRPVAPPAIRAQLSPEAAIMMVTAAWSQYEDVFKTNGITALAMPTVPIPPPLININGDTPGQKILVNGEWVDEFDAILPNMWWTSRFGAPALSIPAGLTSELPVGFMLQGMPGTDSQILGLGIEVEKLIGPMPPPTFRHEPI